MSCWNGLLCMALALLLVSCASKRTVSKSQVRLDAWGNPERFSLGKDESGNPVMKSDLRSSFEGKTSGLTHGRDFNGTDYSTKSYAKKRWAGASQFQAKQYAGNTDANQYKMEPWFVRKQVSAEGQRAAADGQRYAASQYDTSAAREQASERIEVASDAETDARRQRYQQPDIIDWKEQKGLGVKDTNQLLGR
ncbi:MAG: hypothetical protein ACPHNY_06020 [Akkermansiaceae bacterium]